MITEVVYNNLFNNWSGEVEIISNKSGKNKYYNNTFRNYQGTLTLRHGNDCEVYGNYFFANNNLFSGGIRIIGENHKVYNNYVEGVNSIKPDGSSTKTCGGINISNGRPSSALNGYYQVKNAIVTNNTFVNCDYGIRMGTDVSSDLTLAPLNVTVANNIMLNSSNKAINVVTAPTGTSIYQGNIRQTGSWDIPTGTNNNTAVSSGLLTSGTDFYRVQTGSAAIDAGVGSFSFLTKDILNGNRPTANFDAGAEEFGSNGINLPYNVSDVGNTIGFLSYPNTLTTSQFLTDDTLNLYPNPASNQIHIESKTPLNAIEIFDYTGKKVYSSIVNSSITTIDVAAFSKGLYLIKVNNKYAKVVIQ
ncbi:chondroitinase-B domain-containing protein [uncultured Flavobacterium sp.]|uniref:chondroitinase-B domain-containing protein n=1 Tax=uncultured Flavobacterium sp. TaxID=165435 RepID=UPI0030C8323B